MKNIAIAGAGIVGICCAYFLQKSGFKVTLIDNKEPGTMTSYGHACTFADYASIPVNSPTLFRDIPFMLLKSDGPLSVDFFHVIKNPSWSINFLKNCRQSRVEYISSSLAGLLQHANISYDEIFEEVDVKKYIKNEEALYLYESKKAFEQVKVSTLQRMKNGIDVRELNKEEIKELEPNLASIYYKGQVFKGSRHTTNPLAISKKIFDSFVINGGKYLQKKITNVIHTDKNVTLSFGTESQNFDQFVVSTGAWSNIIANYIGDNFPLDTERGYHVLFDNSEELINRPIGWSQSGFYLIQIEEGIRAAGTVEIAGLHKKPNEKRIRMIEKQARKILPQLGKVKKEWMGFRSTLPDSLPVIGPSQKNKRIFYAFGHQHIGWTLGAITGKIIDSLVKEVQPNIDIKAFSPNRF